MRSSGCGLFNISKGSLGRFLIEADKGKHRGCALVVEQMDRLSRQGISETFRLTERIIAAGLEIHVTQANRVVRSMDDLPTVILQAVESHAAQEYSKKLRERVGSAWHAKKHNGAIGVAITNKLPGWLEGRTGEPMRVNEKKAETVRRIFEMASSGMGKRLIARVLNEEGVATFGGGPRDTGRWIQSYIHKVLTNRAVLGEYQPRRNKVAEGDVRIGFYPAVVDHALFQKAQDSLKRRRSAFHGRTGKINSLFTSLVWDYTGNEPIPMHYADKGKKDRPRLVTDTDIKADRHSVVYEQFESIFLRFLDELDWTSVLDVSESEDLKSAETEIAAAAETIAHLEQQIEKLTDLLIDTPSASLKNRLLDAEKRSQEARDLRSNAETRLADLHKRHHDLLDRSTVYFTLANETDIETRAKLREEIRRKVSRIDMRFLPNQRHVLRIEFCNGAVRGAIWRNEKQADGWTETQLYTLGAGEDPFVGLVKKNISTPIVNDSPR